MANMYFFQALFVLCTCIYFYMELIQYSHIQYLDYVRFLQIYFCLQQNDVQNECYTIVNKIIMILNDPE